ncbi:phosphotransferase family protein [Ktedonospora formicarum]|uniref:Aminoglycoside phosphotransferase domain-containing protein n=1 Tax=Ktedonospora formicarum TaxID=2778364 RepID=A0A8J3HXS0_9CHLR|nr:aminoglycoside phosphotransferase family protein [Ktedonospora formicarum]GHO43035.1 hypothetical protein KSX_11980 [Ktedonospora formicarum]
MAERIYSQRLGKIADEQFQAALDHFHLGCFLHAEAIPFGNFGQNVFVTSTTGEYVLRGCPHIWWQFPTEQFFARQLYKRTSVPVPWPYLVETSPEIFGWSFVLMPRMSGLQLADPQVKAQLGTADKLGIARALGKNMAHMQELTWPIAGRYNAARETVELFERTQEFPWLSMESLSDIETITYSERVLGHLRHRLASAHTCNAATTTQEDLAWVEELIAEAQEAFDEPYEPCFLMEDYKEGNLVVTQHSNSWQVSGLFDLMQAHFGDGESDLSRPIGEYLNEDPQLAGTFFEEYRRHRVLRSGFARRFPVYMLLDRAILWEFFQRQGWSWWPEEWTFRNWASQYIAPEVILNQL